MDEVRGVTVVRDEGIEQNKKKYYIVVVLGHERIRNGGVLLHSRYFYPRNGGRE